MTRKTTIALLSGLTIFTGIAVLSGSLAWFRPSALMKSSDDEITGASEGAYYESGEGTAESPFVISKPRHLYNLAWLQYLGTYNKPYENGKQYYFVLKNDIDMTGWKIPPIGTEEYPFIGNFNGQGFVVSNLTSSNVYSEFGKHPSKVNTAYFNTDSDKAHFPDIVGFFGVVGDMNHTYTNEDGSVKAGKVYSSSINEFKNTGLSNINVKTQSTNTMIGMAAGYVAAKVKNVAVDSGTVNVVNNATGFIKSGDTRYTNNLSDYGVVGYTEENFKKSVKKVDQDIYDINISAGHEFNASDSGDDQGWGGSINMKTIYNRIVSLRKTKKTDITNTFEWRINRYYYNGSEKTSERTSYTGLVNDKDYDDAFSRYNGFNETGHEYIGSYNIYARQGEHAYGSDTSTYGDQQYLYLFGGHYESRTYNTYYEHSGYKITDGTNYLSYNNGSLGNTTDSNSANAWSITTGNNKSITTTYNGTTYYLYNNNGTLGIRTSSYSSWTINLSDSKYDIYNGNYHLTCSNGAWVLVDTSKTYINDGTNYMTCSYNNNTTGTIGNTTTSTNGTGWTFSTYNGTGTISCTVTRNNNTYTYYLRNNNGALQATTTTANWTISTSGNNLTVKSGDYYLTYNSGWTLYNPSAQTPYYLIHDNAGHYMGPTSNYITTSVDLENAVKFGYSSSAHGYYNQSQTSNYLGYYSDSYGAQLASDDKAYYRLVNENNSSTLTGSLYGTGYLRAFNKNADTLYSSEKYIRWNNGWTYANNTTNATKITIEYFDPASTPYVSTLINPVFAKTINSTDISTTTGPDYHQTSSDSTRSTNESRMYYSAEDTTYIPLNVGKDLDNYISNTSTMNTQISSGNLDPKDSNTGYIISGANNRSKMQTESELSSQDSDIRISRYAISKLNASYSKSSGSTTTLSDLADSNVYTINTSGTETNMGTVDYSASNSLYPRYSDSKNTFFSNSLSTYTSGSYKTNAYVYGLHFMNSTISADSIVNASKVSVLGQKCDNYQFPVNSIDFNLKQKGVINFFAGSYFDGNDSFFSLHEIIRNNDATGHNAENNTYTSFNTINQIKEIEEVWSNDVGTKTTKYANIYKYKNATGANMYSVPYRFDGNQNKFAMNKSSSTDMDTPYTYATMSESDFNSYKTTYGYTLRFKTSQIGKQNSSLTTNRIYYFEFPMNDGEYCLGSVTGGTGAYLLYLDIGANAAKTQRTIVYEHFQELEKVFDYPLGVAIVATTEASATNESFKETNTANAVIYAGYTGELTITRTANDVTLNRTGGITNAKPTLVGELMWDNTYERYNIHNPGGDNLTNEIVPSSTTTTDIRRVEYYDFNVNLDELTITMITDSKATGEAKYTRNFYQLYSNGDEETDIAKVKIYNTTNGVKYDEDDLNNQNMVYTYDTESGVNTTLIFRTQYEVGDGVTTEITRLLELVVDEEDTTGKYYMFEDYVFKAIPSSGSIELMVVKLGSKTIKIGDTTITAVGQKVTLSAAVEP